MNKKMRQVIYNRALSQDSWVSLIPYPSLLLSWQNAAIKRDDMKTVKSIAAVAGHMNPKHTRCKKKCDIIDEFVKRNLRKQLLTVLKRKLISGQQILDIH